MSLPGDVFGNPLPYFPATFVRAIRESLERYMPNNFIVERPLHMEDPSGVVGIYAEEWVADQDSYVMGGQLETVVSVYGLRIRNVVKATDEEAGRALFANDAKTIRVILYRDPDLRLRLGGLQESMMSTVERFKKFRVMRQEYASARMSGVFQYVATTEVAIETETTLL